MPNLDPRAQGLEVQYRPYQRTFCHPLHTAHGPWKVREGILLRLRDGAGQTGYGEIAPIPWFGTETLPEALAFCQSLADRWPNRFTLPEAMIPSTLPATQFGFAWAWADYHASPPSQPYLSASDLPLCALLPTGNPALTTWGPLWDQGFCTFKWKVGVADIALECRWLEALISALPPSARLRLDANGGLSLAAATALLTLCDRINRGPGGTQARIEYLEQPLPPDQWVEIQRLAQCFHTPLALDESVATVAQLEDLHRRGWRGLWVVKPAILGWPDRLRRFWQQQSLDLIFSSVFETPIGRQAALALAADYTQQRPSSPGRALGFGTLGWFEDDWDTLTPAQLWDRVAHQT